MIYRRAEKYFGRNGDEHQQDAHRPRNDLPILECGAFYFGNETRLQVAIVQSMVKRVLYVIAATFSTVNFPTPRKFSASRFSNTVAITTCDPVTGELTDSELLDDELNFAIDPNGAGKTLIFAVDDKHADLIV